MAPIRNARTIFNAPANGIITPGETARYIDTDTIDIEKVPLNGGFLVKNLVVSVEYYLMAMMREPDSGPLPFIPVGDVLTSFGVGVVIRSESSEVKAGEHVYGMLKHEEYTILKELALLTSLRNEHNLPWSVFIGIAGMPGQTAFVGWKEYSQAKKGETVYVTAGGGPVGSTVIQLAKADGLKVIASAGSDEKVDFLKAIGVDIAFNYKSTSVDDVLAKEGPIDIYWDNVGGPQLDSALQAANKNARFIECGMGSGYTGGFKPVTNLMNIITRSITIHGFIVTDLEPKYREDFYATIPAKLASGEFKYKEDVTEGLENVGEVILQMQMGTNKGKLVIKIADA